MSQSQPLAAPAVGNPRVTRVIFGIVVVLLGALLVGFGKSAFIFCLLIGLLLTGMPVSIALGLTVLTYLFTMTAVPIESVALKLFTGIENFEIMAIPFFILAGGFLTHGGVARRMIAFATSIVGHMHGGLGLAGVLACAMFAAISGSSPATVMAIGSILLPAMVRQGFPNRFGAGVIATSGSLGILIPPSIVMVLYSVSTNTSVGDLFLAGVVPGILLALLLGFVTWFIARRNGYPRFREFDGHGPLAATGHALWGLLLCVAFSVVPPAVLIGLLYLLLRAAAPGLAAGIGLIGVAVALAWLYVAYRVGRRFTHPTLLRAEAQRVWTTYWESVWGLLLIVVVMGGIYSGVFTPTEAAAMSAVYAFLVSTCVYGDLPLRRVPKVLLDSASMSAMLLYIITNAVLFSFLMTSENIPQQMASWILDQGLGPIGFLLVVNVLLLMAGNVMEPSSIVLIMAPILFPVARQLGIDPIHFGILMVVNMEVGMCHPPVGLNLYVASGITRMGITELTVAVAPWLAAMLGFLLLVTYVPAISLWLPGLMR
ncbi:TRAP transporter large permease subunit [Burkholderia pseudomultivorans]|uniref:TRAP transporter large permease protein n=1 Tax=Burkholderia multivorans (strain ATCC 17616 / 249) TaxID=395019 RepID=A0A0H3KN64_BURM1|nr:MULTISPECIES: TRAP transporter large permease subunit [Burkholderia cepacia complex]EGD04877.1 TRAP-type C4-dicarboxylate transport system large permease component [Burkholderia sp. TJI49]ABX17363.1 TRAP dicarboxylate transporter, DctM subunit [Burkholderia multivorans ATCC 17616]AIO73866.1 TRAP transporter, DctM subunit [Burkholderia multivorans]AOK65499.1 C4-dicarboxylate ABC transporter permease [Burkholderia multivorans]AYZ01700.1 TRAP transporter large permease subunit [Burkholderia mu